MRNISSLVRRLVLVALVVGAGAACNGTTAAATDGGEADAVLDTAGGDADAAPEIPADVGGDAEAGGEADAEPPVCTDHNGVVPDLEIAGSGTSLIEYRGYMGTAIPYSVLRVQIMGDNVGTVGPGTYDLAGTTFDDCQVCVSILTGCAVGPCQHFFYPLSGTVELDAVGGEGEQFAGRLRDLRMAEFPILPAGIGTTPLPDGADWCVADYSFDKVADSTQDATCARPTVPCLGETCLDFSLPSCVTGELVSMSSLAAGHKALVYSMVTGWCPYCASWVPTLVGYQSTYADQGLKVAYVYGESATHGVPTAADCRAYATSHGADPNDFYLDNDGTNSFVTTTYAMWPWIAPSDTMGLPWTTILNAQTYEYVYTNQADPDNSEFLPTVQGLLSAP